MRKTLSILSLFLAGTAMAQSAPETAPPPPPEPEVPAPVPTPTPVPVPEPAPRPVEKKPNVGYDKGFFLRSDDGKYSLKIEGRVQPFYTVTRTNEPKDYLHAFEIRRARLVLGGNIHSKSLLYKFQADFGRGSVFLRDFHADVMLANDVWLRFGQWKRPFSRQQINSSGRLETSDRAITDRAFGAGRDIGVAIRNDYEKSPDVEWTVGVFNGTGEASRIVSTTEIDPDTGEATTTTANPTNVPRKFKPAVIGRVGINRNGMKGYSEADLEGGPLRFGVGASVWLEGDFDDDDKSNQKAELDYIVKAEGFSTTGGIYYMTDQDGAGVLDATSSLVGFHLQAGFMVVPKHWQVSARYALVNDLLADEKTTRDQHEITVGGNYYGFGHDAKVAASVRFIKSGEAKLTDVILFELSSNVGF